MKKLIVLIAIVALIAGCSSKQITYDPLGQKTITTRTNEDIYHEAQGAAWAGYYEALKTPPVIAMFEKDGVVVTIHSQVPPPAPIIRQHQNQIIGPVADVIKYGIGGTVAYGITRGIIRGSGDVNVTNSGDGTVITDRSDNIASKSSTATTTATDRSDHSATADPTVVTAPDPVIVPAPDPVIIPAPDPVIVDKDVVIVGGGNELAE